MCRRHCTLAAFLEACGLVVGNDSGVLYLAAAVKRPIVAIFGPTNDLAWGPYPAGRWRATRLLREASVPAMYTSWVLLRDPSGMSGSHVLAAYLARIRFQAACRALESADSQITIRS